MSKSVGVWECGNAGDRTPTPVHPHTPIQSRAIPFLIIGALAATTRFFRLGHQSFWYDEVFSLRVGEQSVPALITDALRDAVHPPLYYLVLHPFLGLGEAEWIARLPSALLGVCFIALLFIAANELLGRRGAWIVAVCSLLSPYQVYFAQETRMYALLECLALLSTILLYRSITTGRARLWLGYTIATFLALMTHYMMAGLILGHGLWICWASGRRQMDRRNCGWWLLSQVGVLLLSAPWIVGMLLLGHSIGNRAVNGSLPTAAWGAIGSFLDFNFGYFEGLFRENDVVMSIFLIGVLAAGYFWTEGILKLRKISVTSLRDESHTRAAVYPLIVFTLVCPIFFSFVVAIYSEYHLPRYFILGYPAAMMILATGLAAAWEKRRPVAVVGGLLLGMLLALSLKNYYFDPTYFREDWRGVGEFMRQSRQPNDLLVFNASWEDLAFRQYYKASFLKGGLPGTLRPSASQVAAEARTVVQNHRRVWLILCYDHVTDPENLVRKWFDQNLQQVTTRQFSQIDVLLYVNPRAEGT